MSWEKYIPENWILRSQREKLGLTQEEVAKRAGITLKQYQRFESLEHHASFQSTTPRIAERVCAALQLSLTDFTKGKYSFEELPADDPLNVFPLEEVK